jgi:PiT family inorganic phosphate transporter
MFLLVVIIILALIFDFINGFHDSANSIATVVSTKVLTPFQAVVWAAFFNFAAFFIFKDHKVANTIANTINYTSFDQNTILHVVLAAILAAICWNLLTWWYGIPSSSSHTLIGGIIGAAIAKAGTINVIVMANLAKTVLFIFLSPIIGMILAFFITLIIVHLCRRARPYKAEQWFKRLQLLSSAAFSLGHGGNDAQKTMGLIVVVSIGFYNHSSGQMSHNEVIEYLNLHTWIAWSCYTAIALGTMSGGWRIVKTMGTRITKVTPIEGVAAETAGASTLILTEALGIPVSTTHTIAGSIMGVGATKRLSAVRWGVTINLVWAWILTIPVSAILAAIFYYMIRLFY